MLGLLHQFQSKLATHGRGRLAQRAQRHRVVIRIEQTIERGAAGVHSSRHLRLREVLLLHRGFNLAGEDTFDGSRCHVLLDAILAQHAVERRSDVFLLHPPPPFLANATGPQASAGIIALRTRLQRA